MLDVFPILAIRSRWADHHWRPDKADLLTEERDRFCLREEGEEGRVELDRKSTSTLHSCNHRPPSGSSNHCCVSRTWSRPWRGRCPALWKQWSWLWWRAQSSMTPQRSEDPSRWIRNLWRCDWKVTLPSAGNMPACASCCHLFWSFTV